MFTEEINEARASFTENAIVKFSPAQVKLKARSLNAVFNGEKITSPNLDFVNIIHSSKTLSQLANTFV